MLDNKNRNGSNFKEITFIYDFLNSYILTIFTITLVNSKFQMKNLVGVLRSIFDTDFKNAFTFSLAQRWANYSPQRQTNNFKNY